MHRVTFAQPGTLPVENLYARIGSKGPHLVFAGHTDVVPPGEPAKWTHPPFAGEIATERLYGRGAVDMKGAHRLRALPLRSIISPRSGGEPKGSISFLITGDEEGIAVNGTVKLLEWARERGEHFDHCILGEPSNADAIGDTIKVGRRGSLNGTLVVTGKQGHVAYPERADNPVRGLVVADERVDGDAARPRQHAFRLLPTWSSPRSTSAIRSSILFPARRARASISASTIATARFRSRR